MATQNRQGSALSSTCVRAVNRMLVRLGVSSIMGSLVWKSSKLLSVSPVEFEGEMINLVGAQNFLPDLNMEQERLTAARAMEGSNDVLDNLNSQPMHNDDRVVLFMTKEAAKEVFKLNPKSAEFSEARSAFEAGGEGGNPHDNITGGSDMYAFSVDGQQLKNPSRLVAALLLSCEQLMWINRTAWTIMLSSTVKVVPTNILLCAVATYDCEARKPGNWTEPTMNYHDLGNAAFNEWVFVQVRKRVCINGEWKEKWVWICVPTIYRALVYGWSPLNLHQRNSTYGTVKGFTLVITCGGHYLPRILHSYISGLINSVFTLAYATKSGKTVAYMCPFIRELAKVLSDISIEENYFQIFRERLQYVHTLLKKGNCGVCTVTWYLQVCKKYGKEYVETLDDVQNETAPPPGYAYVDVENLSVNPTVMTRTVYKYVTYSHNQESLQPEDLKSLSLALVKDEISGFKCYSKEMKTIHDIFGC